MASLEEFLSDLIALPSQIERGTERGLDRAAQVTLNMKNREIDKTYARPVRRRQNGNPDWDRSGDWKSQQRIESEKGVRRVGPQGSSEAYEERLANLPTGPDGVNRTNKAAQRAHEIVEPQIIPILETEILNEIG